MKKDLYKTDMGTINTHKNMKVTPKGIEGENIKTGKKELVMVHGHKCITYNKYSKYIEHQHKI